MDLLKVCDFCSSQVSEGEGYLLTTRQAVTSTQFWEAVARKSRGRVKSMDTNDLYLSLVIPQHCKQRTPWPICEDCISKFPDVDAYQAKEYAQTWWETGVEPPGSRPVDPSVVAPYLSKPGGPLIRSDPGAAEEVDPSVVAPYLSKQSQRRWWEFWK